jgi:hypothetical protein
MERLKKEIRILTKELAELSRRSAYGEIAKYPLEVRINNIVDQLELLTEKKK